MKQLESKKIYALCRKDFAYGAQSDPRDGPEAVHDNLLALINDNFPRKGS